MGYGIHEQAWRKLGVATGRCQIVLCPCPEREEARRIGSTLIDAGLAAAVNIVAQESLFRWQGKPVEKKEYLLIIKSPRSTYKQIERTILDMHSYKLPGIAAVPLVNGLDPYLEWIAGGGGS